MKFGFVRFRYNNLMVFRIESNSFGKQSFGLRIPRTKQHLMQLYTHHLREYSPRNSKATDIPTLISM